MGGVLRDTSMHHVCYSCAMQQLETDLATKVVPPPATGNDSDDAGYRALVARIADGDESALAALYDATAARLYALALRITRHTHDAEDVVEEAYFQIWRSADQYDRQRGRVLAWMLTICRSRALDLLRKQDRAELGADPELLSDQSDACAVDPQQLISMFQRDSAVHAAIAQLPGEQRQLVALAFLRDLSHQQISEQLKMPLGTVKTHIRKALATMRDLLEAASPGGGGCGE